MSAWNFPQQMLYTFKSNRPPVTATRCPAQKLNDWESFILEGSCWVLDRVLKVQLNMALYKPLNCRFHIYLLKGQGGNPHGIVNIQNTDHQCKCCIWTVLAHLHPSNNSDPQKVVQCRIYEQHLN